MNKFFFTSFILVFIYSVTVLGGVAYADSSQKLRDFLRGKPFLTQTFEDEKEAYDYQIGLSALKKVRGSWQFKKSIRRSGLVLSQTWQVDGGYDSQEVSEIIAMWIGDKLDSKILFECKGRSCGSSSQWASRIFERRLLYGRDETQRYAVYQISDLTDLWLIVYSSARSSNRQYLQTVLIRPQDD